APVGPGAPAPAPRRHADPLPPTIVPLVPHDGAHAGCGDPPLLERMDRVAGIPAYLIHGRRDVSSPVQTAWELHRRWPGSRLVVDEGEGHGGVSMVEAWREANDELADRLGT